MPSEGNQEIADRGGGLLLFPLATDCHSLEFDGALSSTLARPLTPTVKATGWGANPSPIRSEEAEVRGCRNLVASNLHLGPHEPSYRCLSVLHIRPMGQRSLKRPRPRPTCEGTMTLVGAVSTAGILPHIDLPTWYNERSPSSALPSIFARTTRRDRQQKATKT